jgi:hypothetical protein
MHCPRCGTQNEEGDRYCVNCGRPLPGTREARERRSFREWVRDVVGTTPRARWITAATAAAIAIAIAAFVALDTAEDEEAVEAYTAAADDVCVEAKERTAATGQRALSGDLDPGGYAEALVLVTAEWRSNLGALDPPGDRTGEAEALDTALRDMETEAAAVTRVARDGDRKELVEATGRVDERVVQVEQAISELELERCSRVAITPKVRQP